MELENEFSIAVRVYLEDTDAGGIVYHVNHLKYMERARTEILRTRGFSRPAILDEGMLLVVASINVDFKGAARLDDQLRVSAKIMKLARTYLVFMQRITRDRTCLTEAEVKVACVNRPTMRPCAIPERVVRQLRRD